MLLALSLDSILHLEVVENAVMGADFCQFVKGFTPLCPTWTALVDGGLVTAPLWIPPEV